MGMAGTRSTGNKLCLWATFLNFLFQTDFGRENSAGFYRQRRQLLLAFLTMVTRCSRSPVPLTGEIMRKIYAASGNVFTDSWSWQSFVSSYDILNCLFNRMYKMKYSCHQDSSVIHGWFIYWVFGWEMRRLLKSVGNPISDGIIFKYPLNIIQIFLTSLLLSKRKNYSPPPSVLMRKVWWIGGEVNVWSRKRKQKVTKGSELAVPTRQLNTMWLLRFNNKVQSSQGRLNLGPRLAKNKPKSEKKAKKEKDNIKAHE